ncbi:MAG: UTRA domain-containing protein [Reinekea sp.]|nr:UTRA domain-containing protein [Reinekea sp.]
MAAPRFETIKKHIIAKVEKGQWQPGDAVPSENALAEQFSVSRMTARRALTELTDAGVLQRTQGAGTFVAEQLPTGSLLEIRNIADEIMERGHRHLAEVLELTELPASSLIAAQLGIAPDSVVFFSRLRHFEEDTRNQRHAIQVEERFVLPAVAPDYLQQDFTAQTPSAYLSSLSPLSEADHWVEAVMPDSALQAWLNISPTTPCLKLSRRTIGLQRGLRKKQIVNFAMLYHPGDKYRLGGHLVNNPS